MSADSTERLALWVARFERALQSRLPTDGRDPTGLNAAIRYSVLNGGKRLRPLLCYAGAALFGTPARRADAAAVAVELIHCYSLVHDDLPAMDDDDLRRGRPTTHRRFGEATAILAGDALQMLAFEILANDPDLPADGRIRLNLVTLLATAGGAAGMTGGQALDLAAEGTRPSLAELDNIHHLKTGRLIQASLMMGVVLSGDQGDANLSLARFGELLGLAFQIQDDILDVEGDTATLGKPQGSDQARRKATYPEILGMTASRQRLARLHDEALAEIADFGTAADPLRQLLDMAVHRRN